MKMLLNGTLFLLLHFVVKSEAQSYSNCKSTCEVAYEDDQKWGIENGGWCILPESCFGTAVDTCWSESMGYPCCKNCEISITDASGDWGIEGGEWCGIPSTCNEEAPASCWATALGYGCCEGCESVYVDKDGAWGYENGKWCGIKNNCGTSSTTKKTTTTTTTTKKTTTTTTKAPAPTEKCRCQYEACGPGICCGAGMSCKEKNGYSQCEPDANAELRPATDCAVGPHFGQWCKGCLVTDTQVDGSLWGWEDKSPCEIKPYECNEFLNADWTDAEHHWPIGEAKGTTTRYWDCCKPSCAWNYKANVTKEVNACLKDGSIAPIAWTTSGCAAGGQAFMCNDQQPWAINDKLSYGFAAANIEGSDEEHWCCACFKITFTSTSIAGKQMIVQVTNTGGDLGNNHFDIQMPGGGLGLFDGCSAQFNTDAKKWGNQYGGLTSESQCDLLPKVLQPGCHWRYGWFEDADNPAMEFEEVQCPQELIDITSCARLA